MHQRPQERLLKHPLVFLIQLLEYDLRICIANKFCTVADILVWAPHLRTIVYKC